MTTGQPPRLKKSQKDRVLSALRARGTRGLTQDDFLPPNVCDGGTQVLRLAARIKDLRKKDGHTISTELVPTQGGARIAVYRLVREAPAPSAPPAAAPTADSPAAPADDAFDGRLFELPEPTRHQRAA